MKPRVLVVEDEVAMVAMLRYNLEKQGYVVDEANDGEAALLKIAEQPPDLILLDWMLPRLSGLETCRRLRRGTETRAIPIIMLTARGEEDDRVRGLDAGADDYLGKPFSPGELLARMRAVLRRTRPALTDEFIASGDIEMDLACHSVNRAGQAIRLGPTEFRLLRYFLEHPGRVLSRDQLLDGVWGRDAVVEQRTVDSHVRRLRQALNQGGGGDVIRTVRSAGYALATNRAGN
jgi:two-component system phosphate regulon response regulator PhoB